LDGRKLDLKERRNLQILFFNEFGVLNGGVITVLQWKVIKDAKMHGMVW
jgi:hypothetical protein